MYKIGFATYAAMPQLSDDDALAAAELRRLGIDVSPVVWDRQDMMPDELSAVVIRSCWNYHLHTQPFLDWIDRRDHTGMQLMNAAFIIDWNIDKGYLRDLARTA